jgi:hypothetical protein
MNFLFDHFNFTQIFSTGHCYDLKMGKMAIFKQITATYVFGQKNYSMRFKEKRNFSAEKICENRRKSRT